MKSTIVQTSAIIATARILNFLRKQADEQMAYVIADPGAGKTSTARYLASKYKGTYYRNLTNQGQYGLIKGLLDRIDGSTCRSAAEGMVKLIDICRSRQIALFIDESEKLNYIHLETLRDIHDEAGVPIFLFGTKIHTDLESHPQIVDRTHFHRLEPPTFNDAKALATRVGDDKNPIAVADDLLAHLWEDLTVLRQIKRSLAYIEEEAIVNQWGMVTLELWGDRPLLPDLYSMPDKAIEQTRRKLVGTK
jgi:replication-associated recombination protein RarA